MKRRETNYPRSHVRGDDARSRVIGTLFAHVFFGCRTARRSDRSTQRRRIGAATFRAGEAKRTLRGENSVFLADA